MDASNEKKWFVYIGDKHEGPFSLEDIQGKMGQGLVNAQSFVWAEGMQDWKVMTEVPGFESLTQGGGGHADVGSISPVAEAVTGFEDTGSMDPKAAKKAAKEAEKEAKAEAKRQAKLAKAQAKASRGSGVQVAGGQRVAPRLIRWMIFLLIPVALVAASMGGLLDPLMQNPAIKAAVESASDAMRPHLVMLADSVPALRPFISPIPRLENISADEFQELQDAARESDDGTKKYAVALNVADLLSPTFYVASNIGDGKQLRVNVSGIGDTLLNHTSFEASVVVTLDKNIAKTISIRFMDGKPLPRGEYIVSIVEFVAQAAAPQQPQQPAEPQQAVAPPAPPKVFLKKQYFLGGPRDATYAARLREYHDRLKAKAASEIAEIKQFAATLDVQMSSTVAAFNKFRAKPATGKAVGKPPKLSKAQMKGWNDLHAKWAQLDGQLSQTFAKWTPDTISHDYFYFRLFQLTQEAGQAITSLHSLQHSYFTGSANMAQFDNELLQTQNLAQASLDLLKAKIDQAEKLPPSPRGLPRREGL